MLILTVLQFRLKSGIISLDYQGGRENNVHFSVAGYSMNWIKLYLSGGLCLVFALIVMFIVERKGGIAAEVADTIPSVVVPIVYILLTQEDMTRIEQANAVFASAIGRLWIRFMIWHRHVCYTDLFPSDVEDHSQVFL